MSDTMGLTIDQHGTYLLLLGHAWRHQGVLPNDLKYLRRILPQMDKRVFKRLVPAMLNQFFDLKTDGWHQKRLGKELEKATKMLAKHSQNVAKSHIASNDFNGLRTPQLQPQSHEQRKEDRGREYLNTSARGMQETFAAVSTASPSPLPLTLDGCKSDVSKQKASRFPFPTTWKLHADVCDFERTEFEKFRDWNLSRGVYSADWIAQWRLWMARARQRQQEQEQANERRPRSILATCDKILDHFENGRQIAEEYDRMVTARIAEDDAARALAVAGLPRPRGIRSLPIS